MGTGVNFATDLIPGPFTSPPVLLPSPLVGEGPGGEGSIGFLISQSKIQNRKLPCRAEAVCLKALAENPIDRYQTMGEFERALA
jgi:hypothetical protein